MDVVILPRLGVTMTSATIVAWEKKEGDHVDRGELLVVIESEKATIELESPYEGFLRKILVEEESEAQVGEPIAVIAAEDEEFDAGEIVRRWEAEKAGRESARRADPGHAAAPGTDHRRSRQPARRCRPGLPAGAEAGGGDGRGPGSGGGHGTGRRDHREGRACCGVRPRH